MKTGIQHKRALLSLAWLAWFAMGCNSNGGSTSDTSTDSSASVDQSSSGSDSETNSDGNNDSLSDANSQTFQEVSRTPKEGFTHVQYRFVHPKYRDKTSTGIVEEFVEVLIPDGAPLTSPVIYFVGGEADMTIDYMKKIWSYYGKRTDMIFIGAEHRGYGQSLSDDVDQSVPDYVRMSEVLEDYSVVASTLQTIYTGGWAVRGRSYCGGVAIVVAAMNPSLFKGVIAASATVDAPLEYSMYEKFIKQAIGEAVYTKYLEHINSLKVTTLFDAAWKERSFLGSVAAGVTQYEAYQPLLSQFQQAVLGLDTEKMLATFHGLDKAYGSVGQNFADAQSTLTLTRTEALSGKDWAPRTYRYQQCTELGHFVTAPTAEGGIYYGGYAGYRKECEALFGANNLPAADKATPTWNPRSKIELLKQHKIPMIVVRGDLDPWSGLMVGAPLLTQPEKMTDTWSKYLTDYGSIFVSPKGLHAGEDYDTSLATAVAEESMKFFAP